MAKQPRSTWLGCILALGLGLSVVPQTSFGASGDIPVTDPESLEALGFDRDAKNVYRAPSVDLGEVSGDDPSAAAVAEAWTNLFAPGSTDYATVWARELTAQMDPTGTDWQYTTRTGFDLVARFPFGRWAGALITDLPNGGKLDWFRVWWYDRDGPKSPILALAEVCHPTYSGGFPTITVLAELKPNTNDGYESGLVSLDARPINTRDCMYIARAILPLTPNDNVWLEKVRIQFRHP